MKKQDLSYCRRCGSEKLVKQGKVFNAMKITWRQQYLCKHCAHKFLGIELHMADSYAPPAFKYQDQPLPKIDWVAYNQAQLNEKTLFLELLNGVLGLFVFEDIVRVGRPTGNVRDILYSMVLKAYLKNSSRRAVSDLKILQDLHFVEKVPCYSTLMNFFNDKKITPILEKMIELSSLPLADIEEDFATDSSGFSTSVFGRWFDHKYGEEKESRIYRKAHVMVGVKTNVVTSVKITKQSGEGTADTKQFKELLHKTALNFHVKEVSADMAYTSRENMEAVVKAGGLPYFLFKSNSNGTGNGIVWHKMYQYLHDNPQEYLQHYHKRSNVESTFSMILRKFGTTLLTRKFTANINEILCKIICHNLCCLIAAYYELGIEKSFCTETYEKQKVSMKL